jgi:dTDP-glucose 4,6-dehydratase
MRVLISGGAGFLASHLTDLLLSQGDEVVAVDNFITGQRFNVERLAGRKDFTFLEKDITEPFSIDGPIDRVYHLASPASPIGYTRNQIATLKANSQGTWNMLEIAVEKGARFLVASTSECYGDPAVHPQREDYWGNVNPIGLRSMYEEAKRFAEACTMAFHRERGADTRIIRIFNTFGPRMGLDDGRVISGFILAALRGQNIEVFGDGTQTRSFCFVSDLIRGMHAAMEADFHEPINLGNPEESSIIQIARDVIELCPGTRSTIIFGPSQAYDPRVRKPDITRARQILGWAPKVSTREGLARTIEYVREHMPAQ